MKLNRGLREIAPRAIIVLAYGALLSLSLSTKSWEAFLRVLYPNATSVVYARASIARLFGEHLLLVVVSSVSAALVGISVGIFVTRTRGRPFRGIVNDLGSLSQTIPPVAVLALAVPAVGFGFEPTILALFLYSVLPILRNTTDFHGMNRSPNFWAYVMNAYLLEMQVFDFPATRWPGSEMVLSRSGVPGDSAFSLGLR